jgi:hypothetical protein
MAARSLAAQRLRLSARQRRGQRINDGPTDVNDKNSSPVAARRSSTAFLHGLSPSRMIRTAVDRVATTAACRPRRDRAAAVSEQKEMQRLLDADESSTALWSEPGTTKVGLTRARTSATLPSR